jgi:cytoskeletal protein CcmA (bactofilin family)
MSAKENARQAWKEILGVGNPDPVNETKGEDSFEERAATAEDIRRNDESTIFRGPSVVNMHPVSIISDGMSVNGDAKVRGDLELRGAMKGNISADGNVTITGKLLGDLRCTKDVILLSAVVQGNISASGSISLDKSSTVIGDVEASSVTIDGKMKGSLTVEEAANFQQDAVLIGDVTAGRVSMNEGAQVVGAIKINMDQVPSIEFKDIEL